MSSNTKLPLISARNHLPDLSIYLLLTSNFFWVVPFSFYNQPFLQWFFYMVILFSLFYVLIWYLVTLPVQFQFHSVLHFVMWVTYISCHIHWLSSFQPVVLWQIYILFFALCYDRKYTMIICVSSYSKHPSVWTIVQSCTGQHLFSRIWCIFKSFINRMKCMNTLYIQNPNQ